MNNWLALIFTTIHYGVYFFTCLFLMVLRINLSFEVFNTVVYLLGFMQILREMSPNIEICFKQQPQQGVYQIVTQCAKNVMSDIQSTYSLYESDKKLIHNKLTTHNEAQRLYANLLRDNQIVHGGKMSGKIV